MTKANIKKALVEVDEILKYVPISQLNKVPQKFREYIEKNKSNEYIYKFDSSVAIEKQVNFKETKLILGSMYLNYWANDEEKKEIYRKLEENENKYKEVMTQKYNVNEVLRDKGENLNIETNLPVEYKENFIHKFMSFVRNIFKKGDKK